MSNIEKYMENCTLCPRNCGVNRFERVGVCHQGASLKAARAALHFWEEPCISGETGSGAVFFSGCNLGCVFCQNSNISHEGFGRNLSVERLSEIFFELKSQDANNINLVTAAPFMPQIIAAIDSAKKQDFDLPFVYNSSGYESVETLKMMEGYIDIYLPDFKYLSEDLSRRYSKAADYPCVAKAALAEMVRQKPRAEFDDNDIITSGVIVRHLVLPGLIEHSKDVIRYLHETYEDNIFVSIMNQFTPVTDLSSYPEINRTLTEEEYDEVVDYAIEIGVENGFIQEGDTAKESFIPEFDITGI